MALMYVASTHVTTSPQRVQPQHLWPQCVWTQGVTGHHSQGSPLPGVATPRGCRSQGDAGLLKYIQHRPVSGDPKPLKVVHLKNGDLKGRQKYSRNPEIIFFSNVDFFRANPNSRETHLVRKRWDIGLLRALSPRIMMMINRNRNLRTSRAPLKS